MFARSKKTMCAAAAAVVFSVPVPAAAADGSFDELSAEWWQWAVSIPVASNPLLDASGALCAVGQHGPYWFLAGTSGGGPAKRTCKLPANTPIFFPVVNSVNFNSPEVCGQEGAYSVKKLRALTADFIDGVTSYSVKLDGRRITKVRRVRSDVFVASLPEKNLFDPPCRSAGGVPAGVYSPSVDDGYYVLLKGLDAGKHTLRFKASRPFPDTPDDDDFNLDVTYELIVVPTKLR